MSLEASLISIHVLGNLVWIGSILAVAVVLASGAGSPADRGALAVGIYKKLAVPGFVASLVAGGARLLMSTGLYLQDTKFMHGKLLFALIVIALHHVIGARAKKMAAAKRSEPGPVAVLAVVLLVSAAAAAILGVAKPF